MFAMHIFRLYKLGRSNFEKTALAYCLFFFCLPFAGFGRELSFGRELGLTRDIANYFKAGAGVVVLIMLGLSLAVWLFQVRSRFRVFLKVLTCAPSLNIYASIFMLALSSIFEKGRYGLPKSMVLEEIAEIAAFVFILLAALSIKHLAALDLSPKSSAQKL